MREVHDPLCPRDKSTMIRPQDCIYCEVIAAVRQDEKDNHDFDMRANGWR